MKTSLRYRVLLFLPAIFLLSSHSAFARTLRPEIAQADKVFTLFSSRVKIMRAVAYDKWMQRTPIEDKKREAAVLKAAQLDAEKLGIQNIEPLIRAQIEIAKAEQRRWHARWDKRGMDTSDSPDLAQSRKQLDRLGKELFPGLKNLLPALRDPCWRKTLKTNFDEKFKSLPESERELFWSAMLQAQIAAPQSTPAKANTK